jgi:hypothetical protein
MNYKKLWKALKKKLLNDIKLGEIAIKDCVKDEMFCEALSLNSEKNAINYILNTLMKELEDEENV